MSLQDLLIDVSSAECFEYPYEPQEIFPNYKDLYNRPLPRLIASFAIFGKRILRNEVVDQQVDTQTIETNVRMCEDQMRPSDFDVMIRTVPPLKTSKIIGYGADLLDSLNASRVYNQVIIAHMLAPTQWAIFLVSLNEGDVDLYLIGDIKTSHTQPFLMKLQNALDKTFPAVNFSWKLRVKFPLKFNIDPVLSAILLAVHLHRHGKYLELSAKSALLHKFKALEPYWENHDMSLGAFTLKTVTSKTHPFIITSHNSEEDPPDIIEKGWKVIDVKGDGNCGYYALLVGLENIGKLDFRPTEPVTGKATSMRNHRHWQSKVLQFRRRLQEHSLLLMKEKVTQKPEWFNWVNAEGNDDSLSSSFFNPKLGVNGYFLQDEPLPYEDQMDMTWGSFVFASLFKVRVVVIMEYREYDDEKKEDMVILTTHIFDHATEFESALSEKESPHLTYEQKEGVYRIPDDDFMRKPTVEILFLTGKEEQATKHFLFLRRVLCDGTPLSPKAPSVSLRKAMQRNEHALVNNDTVVLNSTSRRPGTLFGIADEQENPKKRKKSSETNQSKSKRKNPISDIDRAGSQLIEPTNAQVDADNRVSDILPTDPQIIQLLAADKGTEKSLQSSKDNRKLDSTSRLLFGIADDQENPKKRKQSSHSPPNSGKRKKPITDNDRIESGQADEQQQVATLTDDRASILEPKHQFAAEVTQKMLKASDVPPVSLQVLRGKGILTRSKTISQLEKVGKRKTTSEHDRQTFQDKQIASRKKRKTEAELLNMQIDIEQMEEYFDEQLRTGKSRSAARLYYDSYNESFQVKIFDFDRKKYRQPIPVVNVEQQYDARMIKLAKKYEQTWVGNGPGDPGNGHSPPINIVTKIPTIYQQHNQRFCLTYSLASALFYCGFRREASILSTTARCFATFHFDEAISRLMDFMETLVPSIGRATVFEKRTNNHEQLLRRLTWETVYNEVLPFPTVIIPVLPDDSISHAFCVVDDLIFDSITQYALKLQKESVDWIFNDAQPKIYIALRFRTKISLENEPYNREVVFHWNHPQSNNAVPAHATLHFENPEANPNPVPAHLTTRVPALYHQDFRELNPRFCLFFTLGSALIYSGYEKEGLKLASMANGMSSLSFKKVFTKLRETMRTLVPEIGTATEYPNEARKKKRRVGPLTWESVLNELNPYPTVIFPELPDGKILNAFCIVDDLIFHTISPCGMKLRRETLHWLYDDPKVGIHKAFRFATKFSPPREV